MPNDNSNINESLDSLKEEDEYEKLSIHSDMSEETKAKIRKANSTSGLKKRDRNSREDTPD